MSATLRFEVACAATISVLILARLVHDAPTMSLEEAEKWFLGEDWDGDSGLALAQWQFDEVERKLADLKYDDGLQELLPYAFEVFDTGPTGSSRTADRSRRNQRARKRSLGTFYTPSDVAAFVAELTLRNWQKDSGTYDAHPRIVDPSCGTGVFLLAALDQLAGGSREISGNAVSEICRRSLFGFDISQHAIQSCAFVLLTRCISKDPQRFKAGKVHLWRTLGANLRCFDSTKLLGESFGDQLSLETDRVSLGQLDSTRASEGASFDVVLGNPPYSVDVGLLTDGLSGGRGAAFLAFVRMMWKLTSSSESTAGMVLPLSIGYHTGKPFRALRSEMASLQARWEVAFFDRTPDSLFGDDVKTRNCILFMTSRRPNEKALSTTSLQRWNSRKRHSLFSNIQFTPLTVGIDPSGIPKLGSKEEVEAYDAIRSYPSRLASRVSAISSTTQLLENQVGVGFTAYNYLPTFRSAVDSTSFRSRRKTGIRVYQCADHAEADVVFAMCSSRLAYWLWRVEGDGFHLSKGFVLNLPSLSEIRDVARARLESLAQRLWREMLLSPVSSVNKGVPSLSFSPRFASETLSKIDEILIESLGLAPSFPQFLREFASATVIAGRSAERIASNVNVS